VRDLPTAATTLAELLRDAGVTTAAFTENGAIDRSRGFSRGFDVYFENRDSTRADLRTGHIEQTFSRALDWLAGLGERRFFLFLHTYQVHNPFTPPPGYERFWRGDPGPLAPPAGLRPDWDPLLYDREIRYTDDRVRALVEALREQELLDDTYFVLTSDHGEAFLEHGFVAHGASVHREVLGVPLIITGPGVPAGRRLVNPVPMVDLMPTILDLMNVAGSGLEMGRSQANPVRGMPEAAAPERAIYSEAWAERAYRARGFDLIEQPTTALQLGDWKIIRSRSQGRFVYELYDLSRDPRETNDRFGQYPEETANLLRLLDRYDERVKELHERLGGPIAGTAPGVDPDLEEKLRALGYLD
jgi:arylsulfatase A-like enzyme